MTNHRIIAFAYLDAVSRHFGDGFRNWDDFIEPERDQHIDMAQLFAADPALSPSKLHDIWVGRALAMGWRRGGVTTDIGKRLLPYLMPFDDLPGTIKTAIGKGVAAMRASLEHAAENRLPPDLARRVGNNIACRNANTYLDIGQALGLAPDEQPSDMLFLGSMMNVKIHIGILEESYTFSEFQRALIYGGIQHVIETLNLLEHPEDGATPDASLPDMLR